MTINQINSYLRDNGIIVSHDTDKYYRLCESGIKNWYVENVSEPTQEDLDQYSDLISDHDAALFEIQRIENSTHMIRQVRELGVRLGDEKSISAEALISAEREKL